MYECGISVLLTVNIQTMPTNEKYQERYREKNITIMDLFPRIHAWDIS